MVSRPTYQMLVKRVQELEAEVLRIKEESDLWSKKTVRYQEAEAMALLGHWELNLRTDTLIWSDEIFRIFEIDPHAFEVNYGDEYGVTSMGSGRDNRHFYTKQFTWIRT